jgi:exodeoxyribonuclease VII large subunit
MEQMTLFGQRIYTVSEITGYVRELFENNPELTDTWVQGEISNISRPASGHIYFTLKDNNAALRCVIWKFNAFRIRVGLENGKGIEAHGKFSVYEKDGNYQFYIDAVKPVGEGRLYQEFLRLKASLEAEGLFDQEHKRPIPPNPSRIGIVTSATGAALQDILNTLEQRYPLVEVVFSPTPVQGVDAPAGIVKAMERVNEEDPDVIIVARGGGSLEDLWAFNDEMVVRSIYASKAPVITGVGHETDFTLSDFAADLRAPTPTGAAVLTTPQISDILYLLDNRRQYLQGMMETSLSTHRSDLADSGVRLQHLSPSRQVQNDAQRLDELGSRLGRVMNHTLEIEKARWKGLSNHLSSLNPLAILDRGYAVVTKPDDGIVHSIQQVENATRIKIRVSDGQFGATVGENPKE